MRKVMAVLAVVALVAFAAPALAANPFMDVPMNHWAYDAIGQLAASGIVNGYPDGTFKGNQPMTRYEMATLVARALAVVDMNKASKQDVEMLKKLVVEFKDELDALGVKVDQIDKRVAVLEENIGGWKFWGLFRFDAKFGQDYDGAGNSAYLGSNGKNEFELNRFQIDMTKKIDDNTSFRARLRRGAGDTVTWRLYYVDAVLPWDVKLRAGKYDIDWEDDAGLYDSYNDNNPWVAFTWGLRGFRFSKNFGMVDATVAINRKDSGDNGTDDRFNYGARFDFNINETFRFALSGWMNKYDNLDEHDFYTLYADFGVTFNPNIAFKGAYFSQNVDDNARKNNLSNGNLTLPVPAVATDTPSAWKAILDVKQEAIGFTGLWLEYGKIGEGFILTEPNDDKDSAFDMYGAPILANRNYLQDTTYMYVRASQKWNDKWTTYQRYMSFDFDTTGIDDTTNWTFGVKYQYTPAMSFELTYDKVDYGNGVVQNTYVDDDHIVRLRTLVSF